MNKLLILLFIFFCGWTNLLAFSEVISIPLAFGIILFLSTLLFKRKYLIDLNTKTLFLFLVFVFISFFANLFYNPDEKLINHLLSYFFVIIVYFFCFLQHYEIFQKYQKVIFDVLCYGVLFASSLSIIEFFLQYFYGISIDSFLYRPVLAEYDAIINEALGINRSRSTVEESGHFALYVESLGILSLNHLYTKIKMKIWLYFFVIILFSGYLFTFSVGGVLSTIISLFIYLVYSLKNKFKIRIIFGLLLACLIVYFLTKNNIFIDKINSTSLITREERFSEGVEIFRNSSIFNQLFGFGPAAYNTLKIEPLINLYQVILIETGLIGFCIFLFFLLIQIRQAIYIMKFKAQLGKAYFISLMSVLIHFNFVHNYWYPFVWLLFVLNTVEYRNIKLSKLPQ